jgi:predicted O-linked N-acetylglucosamine transferase (SPINDLY family)
MCSRVAASVAHATGFGGEMVVSSLQEYEERAVSWANGLHHEPSAVPGSGTNDQNTLINLRRNLYLNRDQMPLFDTQRWTRNLEKGYEAAWRQWVVGSEGGSYRSGCIFVHDDDPISVRLYDQEFAKDM